MGFNTKNLSVDCEEELFQAIKEEGFEAIFLDIVKIYNMTRK